MKKDLAVFNYYYSHKRISVFNKRVSVLYFARNIKTRVGVKAENFNTYFLHAKKHIWNGIYGTCRYVFEKLAISDEKYTYKHTLSAKKVF